MVLDSFSKSLDPYLVAFGLPHLSSHLPLILQSLAFWLSLQLLSRLASPKLFPRTYPNLKPSTKTSWDVHFVAFCHATIIVPLVIRVWWNVRRQGGMEGTHPLAKDRTYGYDKQAADVYSIALGYFIWDAAVSILYDGLGFIAHGVLCMTAFTLTFHPVFQYDGLGFLLWELSTPFLNIHWFLDKLNMTGSTAQLVNAAFLLSTYVGARLTFGVYNSYSWFMHTNFVQHTPPIPISIKLFFMIGNVTLNCLNFFWFRAMVRAVQKRFVAKPESKDGKGKGKSNGNEDVDPMKILDGRQRLRVGVKGRNDEALEREVGAARAVRAKDE